jgi:sugar lactone lactonase YvrE
MKADKKSHILFLLFLGLIFVFLNSSVRAGEIKVMDSGYKAVRLAADTPFPGVNGATIGADGNLYVVHTGNGSITRIDLKTMKAKPFVEPHKGAFIIDDIAADDKGNLYATGTTPLVGEVYRFDKNGVKTVIASNIPGANGIEYNKRTKRLFVTECFQGNRVFEIDPEGVKAPRLLIDKDVIPVPEGFDFDPDTNDLIIPDLGTGKILRVHPDTGAITTVVEKLAAPIALVIGADKMAYVPSLTGVVYKVSLDGAKVETIAKLVPGLDNVTITKEGRLFVTSYWDATIFEVATDGSGKFKQLFPSGPNQPLGIVVKEDKVLVTDAIMIRTLAGGKYIPTKLNAWAVHGMPLPLSLTDGPGNQVFWTDCIHGAVCVGDPLAGEFKAIAGELDRPMASLMSPSGEELYVAEYGAGQITVVSLKDGAKTVLTKDLEGPLALAVVGDALYVAEGKPGRITKVDPASGEKEVVLSARVGKPLALANDGNQHLLILDGAGQKILRVNPKTLAMTTVAVNVPVEYGSIGSYPSIEFPAPMVVARSGDIYLTTMNRGTIKLEKVKVKEQKGASK